MNLFYAINKKMIEFDNCVNEIKNKIKNYNYKNEFNKCIKELIQIMINKKINITQILKLEQNLNNKKDINLMTFYDYNSDDDQYDKYYDHDVDEYDENEKLYGFTDDWEDYYDSIYN